MHFLCIGSSNGSGRIIVTRKYLFDKMNEQNTGTINEIFDYLENYLLGSYADSDAKTF